LLLTLFHTQRSKMFSNILHDRCNVHKWYQTSHSSRGTAIYKITIIELIRIFITVSEQGSSLHNNILITVLGYLVVITSLILNI